MASRHIEIGTWLEALHLAQYANLFHQYGGVEDLIFSNEQEIKDLGIRNGAHRAKIISSLRILREKYERGSVTGSGVFSLQRAHSDVGPITPQTPDYQHVITSPEKTQFDLQKELAGDPSELKSHAWYHGTISRRHAESLLKQNGDFIVRDSLSQPGNFVLTSRWRHAPLSFKINAIVSDCAPGCLPSVSYRFEEEVFPTIQQLIEFYQYRQKAVTRISGALIVNPVPRSMPLSYYDSKYGALKQFQSGIYESLEKVQISQRNCSPVFRNSIQNRNSDKFLSNSFDSCETNKVVEISVQNHSKESSPAMNRKGNWTGSQPLLNENPDVVNIREREKRSSSLEKSDSLPTINLIPPYESVSDKHEISNTQSFKTGLNVDLYTQRAESAPALQHTDENSNHQVFNSPNNLKNKRRLTLSNSDSELSAIPPPKPSRIPSVKYKQKPLVVVRKIQVEDDDRDYSDYGQVKENPSWLTHEALREIDVETIDHLSPVSMRPQSPRSFRTRKVKIGNREKYFYPSSFGKGDLISPKHHQESFRYEMKTKRKKYHQVVPEVLPSYDLDTPPPTPSYQIVARSRSFANRRDDTDDFDNSSMFKGYRTLPNKSSQKRQKRLARRNSESKLTEALGELNEDDEITPRNSTNNEPVFNFPDFDYMRTRQISKPLHNYSSSIETETFISDLLPSGHKTLDSNVLSNTKALLLNKTPRTVALHISNYDIKFLKIHKKFDFGTGVSSGLEFITLPEGKQLRQDAIERWETFRMFTMVTILTSQTVPERTKILSLWVHTCMELRNSIGNLYSFTAIMAGLTSPQVQRLTDTWLILRQAHTQSAYIFDTKLRPAFKSLNDGTSDLPLENICVPFILPLCFLLEAERASVFRSLPWEQGLDPIGLAIDALLVHLDTARVIASQCPLYRSVARTALKGLMLEMSVSHSLCTEFHLLLMWGEKGYAAKRVDRMMKLDQVLSALSNKIQTPGDDGTEV